MVIVQKILALKRALELGEETNAATNVTIYKDTSMITPVNARIRFPFFKLTPICAFLHENIYIGFIGIN